MKSIFSQAAELSISNTTYPIYQNDLPELIRKHTKWDYTCAQTGSGYFLKPTFHNMPYQNSFVPEIDIVVSRIDMQTVLYMNGQPVKQVRVFLAIWIGYALMMEMLVLTLAITSNLDSLFPVFIPIIMCIHAYLLCKIATKATFHSIMKAIQKELT